MQELKINVLCFFYLEEFPLYIVKIQLCITNPFKNALLNLMFVLCAYMCLCVGMYVCIENHTYVYIMHKELHGRVATEMLIVVLSERWISGNFYFFLSMLFDFLAMNMFSLYQEEKAIDFSLLWKGKIGQTPEAMCLCRDIPYIIHEQ